MKKLVYFAFLLISLLLTSCSSEIEQLDERVAELESTVDDIHVRISEIESQKSDLSSEVDLLSKILFDEMLDLGSKSAVVSIYNSNYSVAETDLGKLTFSVEDISEYMSGYKIRLNIGNPLNVKYNGLILRITPVNDEFIDAENSTVEISISDTIRAGSWNIVTVTISDFDLSDYSFIRIKASSDSISLNN